MQLPLLGNSLPPVHLFFATAGAHAYASGTRRRFLGTAGAPQCSPAVCATTAGAAC
jgi:hypothetical protein